MTTKIAPSILSADFANLAESIRKIKNADLLHVDVMDGQFVPNITIGPPVVRDLRKATDLPLDVHLMIDKPERYIEDFAKAGSAIITVHAEATLHLDRTLRAIKDAKCSPGVAICPATPVMMIEHVLHLVDLVLIMTVNPGFGGQTFIKEMVPKIKQVKEITNKIGCKVEVEIDGGINDVTAPIVKEAGADILVTGSYVFGHETPSKQVEYLRSIN